MYGSIDLNGDGGYDSSLDASEKGSLISSATFLHIPTLWTVFLQFAILLAFEAFLFIFWASETPAAEYALRTTIHVGIFVFVVLMNRFNNFYHRKALRHGYIQLYRKAKLPLQIPPTALALGNAMLLLWTDWSPSIEDLMLGLQVLFSVELIFVIPALVYYGVLIWKHNKAQAPPDGTKELASDLRLTLYARGDPDLSTDTYLKEVADRQTETIRYLQLQKENLSKQILTLNQRLQNYERMIGSASSDDVRAILDSKEQEIRALKGNINELESSLEKLRQEKRKEDAIVQDREAAEEEKQRLLAEVKRKNEENNKLRLMYEVSKDTNAENQQTIAQLNAELAQLKQQLADIYARAR